MGHFIITSNVSIHFLLQPTQKSASKYIFCKIYEDFSVLDLSNAKNTIFTEKRPFKYNLDFNNWQNLLIFGLDTAYEIKKSCRGQIFEFFSRFGLFFTQKMTTFV